MAQVNNSDKPHFFYLGMAQEGHERCIPLSQFTRLQELHDNQKKLIANLRQRIQDLETKLEIATVGD